MLPDRVCAPRVEMPGDRVVGRVALTVVRRALTLLVSCALATLTPLAHASPPDPVWNTGLYDAEDYDDVILAIIGLQTLGPEGPTLDSPLSLVAVIVPTARTAIPGPSDVRIARPRAPPTP